METKSTYHYQLSKYNTDEKLAKHKTLGKVESVKKSKFKDDSSTIRHKNINQIIYKSTNAERQDVVKQVDIFVEKQKQIAQITEEQKQDPILAQLSTYNDIRGWFDSSYFKNVGIALNNYKENTGSPQKLQFIKDIRRAAQAYLDERLKDDGSERSTQKGRSRVAYMKNLVTVLTEQEANIEFSKWSDKSNKLSEEQEKNQALKEYAYIDKEYNATQAELTKCKNKDGKIKRLSDKLRYLAYEKNKLEKIIKEGKITLRELYKCAEKYYVEQRKANSKKDLYASTRARYDLQEVKYNYLYAESVNEGKSFEKNIDLAIKERANAILSSKNADAIKKVKKNQSPVVMVSNYITNSALNDFDDKETIYITKEIVADKVKDAIAEINNEYVVVGADITKKFGKTFNEFTDESLNKLSYVGDTTSQKEDIEKQIIKLTDIAKNMGVDNSLSGALANARSAMMEVVNENLGERDTKDSRSADYCYNSAMNYLKNAFALADGELKDAIALLIYTVETNSRGNLNIENREVTTYHDGDFDEVSRLKTKFYFEKKREPIFSREPSVTDIKQGALGDCFLLAEMTTIVRNNPQIIKDAMLDEGDTVAVRFYNGDNEEIIRVDKSVVRDKEYNGDLFSNRCLWVQMLEKAFVAYKYKQSFSSVQGSIYTDNLTKLLVKNSNYDDIKLRGTQDKSLEDRLFYYENNFESHFENWCTQYLKQHPQKGVSFTDQIIDARSSYAMGAFRKCEEKSKEKGNNILDIDTMKDICHNPEVSDSNDKKIQDDRRVENKAYSYIVRILNESLQIKKQCYAEMDLDTLRKQYAIATKILLKMINSGDAGGLLQETEAGNKDKDKEWLKERVKTAGKLVDGFIENTIKQRTGSGSSWDDYNEYEVQDYNRIRDAVADKKFIMLDGRAQSDLKNADKNDNMKNGIMGNHAYCILDTKEIITQDRYKKKMVLIKNPHGTNTAVYRYNKTEGMTRHTNTNENTAGLFWLDIRDMESCYRKFSIFNGG